MAVLVTGLVFLLRYALNPVLGTEAPLLAFTIAVMVAGWYGGLGPGLFATGLSLLIGKLFFIPPVYSLEIERPHDTARIFLFILTGVVTASLNESLRRARVKAQTSVRAEHESEERFRLLVEGVKDYALFMLDPQGRVASWNPGAALMKGYAEPEIIGKHFSAFYTPEDIARHWPEQELSVA